MSLRKLFDVTSAFADESVLDFIHFEERVRKYTFRIHLRRLRVDVWTIRVKNIRPKKQTYTLPPVAYAQNVTFTLKLKRRSMKLINLCLNTYLLVFQRERLQFESFGIRRSLTPESNKRRLQDNHYIFKKW